MTECDVYEAQGKVTANMIDQTYRAGVTMNFEFIVRDKVRNIQLKYL